MNSNLIALKQLDLQLLSLKKQGHYLVPKQGWVRTLRKALGMTINQLAKRLHVDPSRIVKIETSEVEKAVTLRTLQSVAEAFDCTLVYSFIPNSGLEKSVQNQARKIATEQIKKTAHTMDLEAQSIEQDWLDAELKDLTYELLHKSWKHLWEEK
jgi:predicted DNA-binding mobile mystery protein A